MKVVKFLVIGAIIIGGGLFGAKYVAEQNPGELAGTMDQLNPLVAKGEVYVKTQTADSTNEYGITTYTQTAADANGKTRKIMFTADHQLKLDHYLKISNKGAHVETYEEVTEADVPEQAMVKIR